MKNFFKKSISLILSLAFIISFFNINSLAATICYTNFYSADYSSDPGQYMANIALAQKDRGEYDIGYGSTPWCAYFVIDCARIANQTSAIPEGYGRCDTLWAAITQVGGYEVYSGNLRPGDLIFYDCPKCDTDGDGVSLEHVGIVIDETYSIEGNLSDKAKHVVSSTFIDAKSHSVSSGTVKKRYLRPNYSGAINSAPTNAWVSIPKGPESTYYVNEVFDITVGADNATNYYLRIYKGNEEYWSGWCASNNNTGTFSGVAFDKPGKYSCFVEATNSAGYVHSSWIGWNIVDTPSNAWVSLPNGPESSYKTNESFNIEYGADNATQYYLNIYDSNGLYYTAYKESTSGITKTNVEFYVPGHYSCFVEAYGPNGKSIRSEWIGWDIVVDVPTDLSISVDREEKMYRVDENVNFNLYANLGYYKHIGIHRVGGGMYTESDVAGNNFSINITEPGEYYANFDAFNACGSARSEMVYFTIVDSVPEYSELSIVGDNKSIYTVGDTITFKMNTQNEHSKYIGIHKNSSFYTGGYIDEDTYSYKFTEAGSYLVSFDALNNYGYTRSNSVTFEVYEPYTVQYNASDATNIPSQQIKKHNTDIYLTQETPTKNGYIFKCWNTSADGSGVSYAPGDTYTANADLTLHAIWESATLILANSRLDVDRDNGIIYGTDLLGMRHCDLDNQFANDNLQITKTCDSRTGTGTVIELVDSKGNVYDSLTVVIFGDIDGNGWYDANDAFLVNMLTSGLISAEQLSTAEYMAADCNHDGTVNELDFNLISSASVLLDNIDQSESQTELELDSNFIAYCSIIDQSDSTNPEMPSNNNVDKSEETIITTNEPALKTESIFNIILHILSKLLSLIYNLLV